jgi:hypothetical protein
MWAERVDASQYGIDGFTLTDSNNAPALGAYLGNYVLGFQTLFDPDSVAATMDAAYATNAPIATDATYSGITYYLTHSLRALGDQDLGAWTSIPTSQVYTNARTGQRTIIIYNPGPTNQIATVFQQGVAVSTLTAPARTTLVTSSAQTNSPSRFPAAIQPGMQVSWPTTSGKTYEVQWAPASSPTTWTDLATLVPGDGNTNFLFDTLWPSPHRYYRVLEISPSAPAPSIVVNGGFEAGSGTTVSNWSQTGSQPPTRISTSSHGGSFSLSLSVTNPTATPNSSSTDQNVASQGGPAVVPGQTYNFSFWAYQASSGPSLVQNYTVTWLNSSGTGVGDTGWTGFSGGGGFWTQISANNLVAPTSAVNASITIYGTTGAVTNGFGNVLIDDISLARTSTGASQTNLVSSTGQGAIQISWPSTSGALYDVQSTGALGAATAWADSTNIQGNGSTNAFFEVLGTNQCRFYRVLQFP